MNDPDAPTTTTKPTEARLCIYCRKPISAAMLRDLPNQQSCARCAAQAMRGMILPWKRRP